MAKLTNEIIIAGTTFGCEPKAKQVLQKYFKSVKKQLAGNEDADTIYEDIEQAVSEKISEALTKKQKTVSVTIARYVVETTGMPELEHETNEVVRLSNKQKVVLFGLSVLAAAPFIFWLVPLIFRLSPLLFDENAFIYQKLAPMISYFFGLMPLKIPLIIGSLYISCALFVLVFCILNLRKQNRTGYRRAIYALFALIAVSLISIAGSTALKMQKYERISASNPTNSMAFTSCGKTIQVGTVIMQGQELALFEDAIQSGWVYVGDISGDISKLPETGFYFDGISCEKLAKLQAQHPNKKYFVLEIKKGPNGQIFEGGEFSRAGVSESYFGLFVK